LLARAVDAGYFRDSVSFACSTSFPENPKMLCFTGLSFVLLPAMATGAAKTGRGHIIAK
jgi:hypothetical protein